MNLPRRDFLKTSLAASVAAALATRSTHAATPASAGGRDYYELRCYRLKPEASPARLDAYLAKALLPALAKRGVGPIGVFTELDVKKDAGTATPKANSPWWVLIPHPSLDSFVSVAAELNTDAAVQAAGADYLGAAKALPAFDRIDSWLLLAFKGLPKLALPSFSRERVPTRVFEMRTYESFSEAKALLKMAMFDDGEIDVMKDVGMSPVFYGQALAGRDLPHLTYMTGASDLATHLANWKKFGTHPGWVKMRSDPKYADSTSKNTPYFLTPTAYSQI
jgi:hypothetical protein